MDRQGAVEHGARRASAPPSPAAASRERHQGRLARRGDQQQQPDHQGLARRSRAACSSGQGPAPSSLSKSPSPREVVQRPRPPAAGPRPRRGRRPRPTGRCGTGAGRSWKNATSSADDSPTSSQPANSVSIVPASDGQHHARARTARRARRSGCSPRSRCMYRLANAPTVPHSTNDRIANGTDSRSKTNLTEKW